LDSLSNSENEKVMHEAVNTLIKLHSLVGKEDLTNKLLELMNSKNERLQIISISALHSLGWTKIINKGILNKLREFVESEDEGLQLAVIQTLLSFTWKVGVGEDERLVLVKKLLKLVDSKNEEIQSRAIYELSSHQAEDIGRIGGELIDMFLERISSESETVRLAAAYGLNNYCNDEVVNKLLKFVDSNDEKIQDAVVAALSASATKKEKVANKFLELIDSKNEIVQVRAICAMIGYSDFGIVRVHSLIRHPVKVDEKKIVNNLLKALECESEQVQAAALWALIELNKGKKVKEKVINAFESESELLQLVGICGLTKLEVKNEKVTERLLKDIESENALIQASAGKVLERFIEPTEEILRIMSTILYNDKASKERIGFGSVPVFLFFEPKFLPDDQDTPCDCIYEALKSLVERWEAEKLSHKTKANNFS